MRRQWLSPMLLAATMLACVGAVGVTQGAKADTSRFDGTDSGLFGRLDLNTGVFTQAATLHRHHARRIGGGRWSALDTGEYQGTAFYRLDPCHGRGD